MVRQAEAATPITSYRMGCSNWSRVLPAREPRGCAVVCGNPE
jgi:hypothetical protein